MINLNTIKYLSPTASSSPTSPTDSPATSKSAARPYYEQALAIFESTLGPDHPYTQSIRDNLAALDTQLSAES